MRATVVVGGAGALGIGVVLVGVVFAGFGFGVSTLAAGAFGVGEDGGVFVVGLDGGSGLVDGLEAGSGRAGLIGPFGVAGLGDVGLMVAGLKARSDDVGWDV